MRPVRFIACAVATMLALSYSAHGLERLTIVPLPSMEECRLARQEYLDDLLRSMQSKCELTDRQFRRLQIASKGAVEYSFSDERRENNRRVAAREIGWRPVARQGQRQWVNSQDATAAARHPIWTQTLAKTLTTEQLEKAKTLAVEHRKKWSRQFARQIRDGKIRAVPKLRILNPEQIDIRQFDVIVRPQR